MQKYLPPLMTIVHTVLGVFQYSSGGSVCDWIFENRSKLHISTFEIDGFKDFKQW